MFLISRGAKVPDPPEGEKWKAIQYDNKVRYVCYI